MIDIMRTILSATDEYEMRYGKRPVLFINRVLYNYLMSNVESRYGMYVSYNNMLICGYPAKIVYDDSSEMHFWIGDQKPIYGKEN